jgi:hypothetical protein
VALVPQLCAVALFQNTKRRLDETAWDLWSMGFPITSAARRAILNYLKREKNRGRRHLGPVSTSGASDDTDAPIDQLRYRRLRDGLGRVRRRVGSMPFATSARLIQEFLVGELHQTEHHPHDFRLALVALAKLFGRSSDLRPTELHRSKDLAEALLALSRRGNLDRVRDLVSTFGDPALEMARDQARGALRFISAVTGQPEHRLTMRLFQVWLSLCLADPGILDLLQALEIHPELGPLLAMVRATGHKQGGSS